MLWGLCGYSIHHNNIYGLTKQQEFLTFRSTVYKRQVRLADFHASHQWNVVTIVCMLITTNNELIKHDLHLKGKKNRGAQKERNNTYNCLPKLSIFKAYMILLNFQAFKFLHRRVMYIFQIAETSNNFDCTA